MGAGNDQSLEKGRGVAGDCKSEGSHIQNPELRNTNSI
jgi:hypothetical protein